MRVFSQAILKLDARAVALAMFLSVFIVSGAAWAQCPLPSGNNAAEGVLIYNSDHKVMQYCNGDNWVGVWGGGSGSGLPTCDDGEIAQWQGGKWECNDGSALPQEKIGTLTNGRWCTTNGSVINCTANPPLVTESDPKVGTLANGQWCRSSGSQVVCDQNPPPTSITETDPKVGTLHNNHMCRTNGSQVICDLAGLESRAGVNNAPVGHRVNFNWSGGALQAWVDVTHIGNVRVSPGSPGNVSCQMGSNGVTGSCVVHCPAGWIRTGCSADENWSSWSHASPDGNGCRCSGQGYCHAYCIN